MGQITKRGEYQWRAKVRRKGFPEQSRTFTYREDGSFRDESDSVLLKLVQEDNGETYLYQKSYSLPMRDSVKGYVFNPMLEQVFNLGSMSK